MDKTQEQLQLEADYKAVVLGFAANVRKVNPNLTDLEVLGMLGMAFYQLLVKEGIVVPDAAQH